MKKRLISLLLVFAMVLTMLPVTALAAPVDGDTSANLANPFTDVKETDWCYDAVQYVRVNGIFNGTTRTTFTPNGTMTRGMFVTVLGRMAGVDAESYKGESAFTDVPADKYYAPYVAWASKHGITLGTGDGKFSPDALINRAQMSTFFVRYFELFGVDYETDANITTTPADLASIPAYAKDAALKLWKQGLLNGDGTNFNPAGNASRAQAATLCMRTDKAVDTWYSEPGVASERVSIDPTTGEAVTPGTTETPTTPSGGGSSSGGGGSSSGGGGSSGGGTTTTTYYEVQFAAGSGQDATDWTLPETKTYTEGTKISLLPTPYKQNGLFMGWYYDAAMTNIVGSNDTVTKNMTLYAKLGEVTAVSAMETPNYMTVTVPAEGVDDYTFGISGYTADAVEYFTHVSNLNADMEYSVSSGNVRADYEQGQTYSIKLEDNSTAVFVVDGVAQPVTIRVLNIITEKGEVQNLTLDGDIKYIPKESVSYDGNSPMAGLFNVALEEGTDGETQIDQVSESGTFTYEGSDITVGDTVAIYEGTRPDLRTGDTTNDTVVYVQITGINGTTYTYITANTEEVLFTPDVLPVTQTVASAALATVNDGTTTYNLTVAQTVMDFSDSKYAAMGLNAETTVDVGDFIAIYSGVLNENNADNGSGVTSHGYGRITGVDVSDGNYIITYVTATQDEVLTAMDLYDTRNEEIVLTDDKIQEIEEDMVAQAIESGFVDEAAEYLVALALETDGFQELSDDLDMDLSSYSITFADGTPVDPETMDLMAVKAEITQKNISAKVNLGELDHFDDNGNKLKGLNAELVMTFTVEVGSGDNKLVIELEAVFEQEVLLNINVSGGAIWKWAWIFPYIYDYQMNANIDVGTYTGIGITATAKTSGADDEGFDWKMSTGNSAGDKIISIGSQIKELMDQKEEFMGKFALSAEKGDGGDDDDDASVNSGGLAEKYADFMENAEESWIDIVRVEIFSTEGYVDMFHILCYGIGADFVVSANLYVTIGMTFEFAVAKRYNFSLTLFHKQSTSETIDLQEAYYQFDFYVMGTIGVRAGVEFEIAIGLFSLKLDSVGICAEVGAYAQMWGYFYYSLVGNHVKNETTGKKEWQTESSYSGAMYIEIGLYLTISFKAQLFSSDKLTYQPTLYDNQWPLWSFGKQQDVYDFAYEDDDPMLTMEVANVEVFTLSSDLFRMNYMDMKDGTIYGTDSDDDDKDGKPDNPPGNFDSDYKYTGEDEDKKDDEEHFYIEVSNPKFKYSPAKNWVSVSPGDSIEEDCTITITWNSGPLAFSSRAIQRTLTIHWTEVEDVGSISFDTMGGSAVPMITARVGAPISAPTSPTKEGYSFDGWYWGVHPVTSFPTTMEEGNTTYVATWKPNTDTKYTVEHYQEQFNGTYQLVESNTLTGTTDGTTAAVARDYSVLGYKDANTFEQVTIAPDGTTVVKLYYDLREYTVTFKLNNGDDEGVVTQKYLHGQTLAAPMVSYEGNTFTGWSPALPETVTSSATYRATWDWNKYDVTFDSRGGSEVAAKWAYHGVNVDAPTAPTKEGHTFGGWYQDTNYTTAWDFATALTSPVTLYAKWTVNSFDVRFHVSGNDLTSDADSIINVTYGQPYGTLPEPTKDGYTFCGWYTAPTTGGDRVLADTVVTSTGAHHLYARWAINSYTATFDSQGGTSVDSQTMEYYGILTKPATDPTKEGYTFGGWYTDKACTKSYDFNGNVTGNVTLYAKWTINQYTVTWDLNGENTTLLGDSHTKTADYNTQIVAPTGAVREADAQYTYTFAGWYTAAEGGEQVTTFGKLTGDVTYYAHWSTTAEEYTVTFYPYGANGATITRDVAYGSTVTAPDNLSNPGYTLEGWYIDSSFKTKWNLAENTVEGDMSLYAKWTEITYTYTVTLDFNNGSNLTSTKEVTSGQTYGDLYEPTRNGYTFAGWWTAKQGGSQVTSSTKVTITADQTLYAHWTGKTYTINYVLNGGTMPSSYPTSYVSGMGIASLAEPTRDGYTFAGWYRTYDYSGDPVTSIDTETAKNLDLYANWTGNSYTVTFDPNGGTVSPTSKTVIYGSTYGDLPTATKENYVMTGWYTAAADDTEVTSETKVATAAAHTLYAHWTGATFNITYEGVEDATNDNPTTYSYGSTTSLNEPEKDGYAFKGWKLNGSDTIISAIDSTQSGDITLTATWAVTHTVTFSAEGGSTVESKTVEDGQTIAEIPTSTRTDYKFLGWYTAANGEGTQLTTDTLITANVTYYAHWTEDPGYNLWVSGTLVTESNYTDVLGDGTVTYDPKSNTLTLNGYNPTITTADATKSITVGTTTYCGAIVYQGTNTEELIINVTGDGSWIQNKYLPTDAISCGIFVYDVQEVGIKGDGNAELTIHVATNSYDTSAGCAARGISVLNGSLYIYNTATVRATTGAAQNTCGIYLDTTGSVSNGYTIQTGLTNFGTVTAEAGRAADSSYGICGSIGRVGTLTAQGYTRATYSQPSDGSGTASTTYDVSGLYTDAVTYVADDYASYKWIKLTT